MKNNRVFTYDIENVSLLDINDLIDRGDRFTLVAGLDKDEYDVLQKYSEEENDVKL